MVFIRPFSAISFLYRFGDPARYSQGHPPSVNSLWETATSGNKQIGGSSNVQWIAAGLPGAGHLLVFNNNQYLYQRTPQSYVFEINPYLNSSGIDTGAYVNPPTAGYNTWTFDKDTMKANQLLSKQVVWKYGSTSNLTLFSHFGSSAQRLANGNTLICATTEGYLVEVDASGNVVWEYINPVTDSGIVTAIGDDLPMTWLAAFVASVTIYEFYRGALARHRKSGENFVLALWNLAGRNRRRYGGYVIHLGVVLMAIGIIGIELFQTETQGTIAPGESLTLGKYTVTFTDLAEFERADGRLVTRAVVDVNKNGQYLTQIYPRRDYYFESQQPMTIPGVRSTREDDLYVLLVDWQPISSDGATFKIYHNPLVNWLWLGGIVFILGTLIAAWPDKDPEDEREGVTRRSYAGVPSVGSD